MSAEAGNLAALGSSIAWGSADYVAGVKSRSLGAFRVVFYSQTLSCIALLGLMLILRPELSGKPLAIAAAGGCAGGIGLLAFYRAMAVGAISVAAPVSALGVCVPVLISALGGELPAPVGQLGMFLAIVGIVAVSIEKRVVPIVSESATAHDEHGQQAVRPRIREGVIEACVAALGFGIFLSALNLAMDQDGASTLAVVTASRTGSALLLVIVALASTANVRWPGRQAGTIFSIGMVDFAANSMLAWASVRGSFAVVAVLGSMYPLVPMILARILLKERLGITQRLGTITIVIGVVLIALAERG